MNWVAVLAALSGAIAVVAGAFGAHAAHGDAAEWFKTGGHYQLIHAVAALIAAYMGARGPAWCFIAGGALFGGSLYAMALGFPKPIAGPITPLGGAFLIAGWLWLAWHLGRGGRI